MLLKLIGIFVFMIASVMSSTPNGTKENFWDGVMIIQTKVVIGFLVFFALVFITMMYESCKHADSKRPSFRCQNCKLFDIRRNPNYPIHMNTV